MSLESYVICFRVIVGGVGLGFEFIIYILKCFLSVLLLVVLFIF